MSETFTPELSEIGEKESSSEKESDQKEKGLEALKGIGVLEKNDRDVIVDLEKLKDLRLKEVGLDFKFKQLGFGTGKIETLNRIFEGQEVTSKEDWAQYLRQRDAGEAVELPKKDLFYSPKSREEALDPKAIKQADFYLGPWEVSQSRPDKYLDLEDTDVSFSEVAVAALIYHPQYGAGHREDNGRLQVNYADGSRRPISTEYFKGISFKPGGLGKPREYVTEQLPHLVQSSILKPEDFEISTTGSTADKYRVQKTIKPEGMVMLNRVHHIIGREYAGMNISQLTPTLGAVVSGEPGNEQLEATFNMIKQTSNDRGIYPIAKKDEVKPIKFDPETSSGDLVETAHNFADFLKVSNNISHEYGVNLANLSLPEQQSALILNREWGGRKEFKDFVKRNGELGLKTLISVAQEPEKIRKVFALGGKKEAPVLFHEYNTVRELASRFITDRVGEDKDTEKSQKIYQALTKRAENLLLADEQKIDQTAEDKIALLQKYHQKASRFLEEKFGFSVDRPDKEATLDQLEKQKDPNLVGYLETSFELIFDRESRAQEGKSTAEEIEKTTQFYQETGETLYAEASETTGDTELERARLDTFLQGFGIKGSILDAGSSDGERITSYVAGKHAENRFIGLDLEPGNPSHQPNAEYVRGSFTHIPLADRSVDAIYSVWSPINDITNREDQIAFIKEFSRVTQDGGMIFLDVPYMSPFLNNGWYQEAVKYHQENPQVPLGTIKAAFKTDDGSTASKEFYIYFTKELEKLLTDAGFEMLSKVKGEDIENAKRVEDEVDSHEPGSMQSEQKSPISTPIWVTKGGKPRITLIARKTGNLGENLKFLT